MGDERPLSPETPSPVPQPGYQVPAPTERFSDYRSGKRFPLREMDVGQLLDAMVNLFRVHWKTFLGMAAIVLVPIYFLQAFLTDLVTQSLPGFTTDPFEVPTTPADPFAPTEAPDFGALFAFLSVSGLGALLTFIASAFLTAAVTHAAARTYQGEDPTISGTYGFSFRRLHSIMWVIILQSLAVLGGFLLCIIPGFIFLTKFLLSTSVLVVEGSKGTHALRRSWQLTTNHFWKVFGVYLLTSILAAVLAGVFQIPFQLAGILNETWGWVLIAVGNSIAGILTIPFPTIAAVLLYFDLRVRKEGLDLAVMAQELSPAS